MGKILLGNVGNVRRIQEQIVPSASIETGTTASKEYKTGDYVVVGDKLKRVINEIGVEAAFDISNISDTNISNELESLNNSTTYLQKQIVPTASIETTHIASQAYSVGDYFVVDGFLMVATATINKGDTFSSSNSTITNIGERLTELEKTSYVELGNSDIINTKVIKECQLRVWKRGAVYAGDLHYTIDTSYKTSAVTGIESIQICKFPYTNVSSVYSQRVLSTGNYGKYSIITDIQRYGASVTWENGNIPTNLGYLSFMTCFVLI